MSREQHVDRLLLVDDNPTNLQVLFEALQAEGYELLVAQSGEEAIATVKQAQPELILLDINMPGMDGYETCRRLKAEDATKESVIIFLSARGDVGDKVRGLELGAVDYISKPFQFEEVVARVRKHLAIHHQHRELNESNRALKEQLAGGFAKLDEADLKRMVTDGESDSVEFKSTLRWNLHSNKPDKRMENTCLKTVAAYLNSNGGVLLVGVDDEGRALGMSQDQFANEDKLLLHWHGLIKTHLGMQAISFTRATMRDLDDRRVLLVQCLPSRDPVFFRRDNDETFFVRTGNGTHALKPSEVLAYVDRRSRD
jgi:DNA-binding response OmpR family regulator